MSYVLVVNARAGSTERDAVDAAERILAGRGACDLIETEGPDHVDDVMASLDGRQVVVAGGDGSVHLAVERLHNSGMLDDITVAWVPLGTGNDLARTLGIPLDPEDAAKLILEGGTRQLDLIVADDGAVCVNALHAGVGVDAAARAEALKERIGEFAYPLGALAAGVTAEGWAVEVEVDDQPIRPDQDGNVLLVAAMNGRSYGGGTEMSPTAEPDDGQLDVIVCTPLGPAKRAAFGMALQTGTHLDRDDVHFRRGRSVVIRGEPIGYNIDGELDEGEWHERSFRVEPSAWRIIAPA